MKNKLNICLAAAITAVLMSAVNCNNTPTSPGKMILMNYPKGGETFSNGDRVIIQWTATGGIENVDIVLFANFNDYGENLAQNIPAEAGQFIWTIQTCPPYDKAFVIEISDSASFAARTTSLGFTIKQCSWGQIFDFLPDCANMCSALVDTQVTNHNRRQKWRDLPFTKSFTARNAKLFYALIS